MTKRSSRPIGGQSRADQSHLDAARVVSRVRARGEMRQAFARIAKLPRGESITGIFQGDIPCKARSAQEWANLNRELWDAFFHAPEAMDDGVCKP